MKLLIITASAGMGHNRAAQALEEYTKINRPDIQTKKIDLIDYLGFGSQWFYFKSYEQIIKIWPKFWYFWFWLTENKITGKIFDYLSASNKKLNLPKFSAEIKSFQPDYILCTHFTPPDLIENFSDLKIPLATVVTDYFPCRLWSLAKNQKFFVAHEFTKLQLEKYGINPKNIIISGIPIDIKFFKKSKEAKIETKKNILIMPVPKGEINLEKLIKTLNNFPNYKINIICGKNKTQKNNLEKKFINKTNITILGLINNPEDFLNAADIVISKAGGITISEILICKKPLIVVNPIPGQETKNAKFLADNNLAIWAHDYSQITQIIKDIDLKNLELKTLDFVKNPAQIILENFLN